MTSAVARVGGLPFTALNAVACPDSTALAIRVAALTTELVERSAALSEALYEVIGASTDRGRLVAIRRDLHGLRRPRHTDVLPRELAGPVREWIALWEQRATARAALPAVLADETRKALAATRMLAAAPAVRHGLVHASPDLSADLEKWLADPARKPRAGTLASLLRYATRVATKTSPFSTFTTVHRVQWVDRGPAWEIPDTEPRVDLDADVGLRLLIETVRPKVLRLSPSAHVAGDRYVFLGQDGRVRVLPRTESLDAVVDGLREGAVKGRENGLSGLIETGLAEAVPPVPGQQPRPFAELGLERLQKALDEVTPLGDGDPADSACTRAAQVIVETLPELDLPVLPLPELRSRVLRESVRGEPVRCARPAWEPALADLRLVRRWLAVHDPMLPLRLTLADRLRDWFGPDSTTALLAVYARVRTEQPGSPLHPHFLDQADPLAGTTDPRLRELRALRAEEPAVREVPPWIRDPGPITCYVQPYAGPHGDVRLVLNAAHGGYGRGISRWTAVPVRPRDHLAAELPGTFGHSLNLHRPGTAWELEFPGAVGRKPPERRIPLAELVVRHDDDRAVAELWWPRAGQRVVPVHAGMMSETLLPPLARLLVEAFGTTHLTHPTLPAIRRRDGPRVELGRITLARAQWTVSRDEIPRRGHDDAGHLVAVHTWLRSRELPRRCFVQPSGLTLPRDRLAFDKRHKPVFVDFGSWPSVLELDRLVASGTGDLVITEVLPDADRAVELAIEVEDT
ncbi:lantibiotic dehydratase [Lentzea sp. NEAU-D7]|uniref:lantibiotic dehydratase n=1 Tax=Lentzea sp. NEAU-D7 TaxID=2994667 RepID=UPI00224AC6EB|nr:lantibiotic dehydratase [Lentzea sp. NEAU-D7]MCX2951564.1 lantibiotic dehydratase [Lentzea sp. NEAU-D7]